MYDQAVVKKVNDEFEKAVSNQQTLEDDDPAYTVYSPSIRTFTSDLYPDYSITGGTFQTKEPGEYAKTNHYVKRNFTVLESEYETLVVEKQESQDNLFWLKIHFGVEKFFTYWLWYLLLTAAGYGILCCVVFWRISVWIMGPIGRLGQALELNGAEGKLLEMNFDSCKSTVIDFDKLHTSFAQLARILTLEERHEHADLVEVAKIFHLIDNKLAEGACLSTLATQLALKFDDKDHSYSKKQLLFAIDLQKQKLLSNP